MNCASSPNAPEPRTSGGGLAGGVGRRRRAAVLLYSLLAAALMPTTGPRADEAAEKAARFPSKVILGLRATCMSTCQDKEDAASCARYCDCHLFELRRDLSDSQVEQLLLTAERGGTGAEAIRKWLHSSALVCEKRVFGDGPKTREPG